MKTVKLTSAFAIVAALSACAVTDTTFAHLGQEAGHELSDGKLGLATANNVGMQTGQLVGTMAANLTRKFASEVPARITFAFNSATLDATAKANLRKQAQWIKAHPQIVFRVYGHTDKVGSRSYNQRLGKRRAVAAVNYLVALGASRSKLQAVASFGESRPVVLTEAANRENRRTVTEVSGFAKRGRASDLDGKYAKQVYDTYISTTFKVASSTISSSE